jgi:hypothetical protein
MYDPKSGKWSLIDTCFTTHHLYFAHDADNTLWTSAGGPQSGVVGWLNTRKYEETGDEAKSQGWTPIILDTNGNGKRDAYVEADQPVDPAKGQADHDGVLWRPTKPDRRFDLGPIHGGRFLRQGSARVHHSARPRAESLGDRIGRNLRAAG